MLLIRFGERLERIREARGYRSQAELARQVGVSATRYFSWEKGKALPGSIGVFLSLCDTLGVTSDYLLFGRAEGLSNEAALLLLQNGPK